MPLKHYELKGLFANSRPQKHYDTAGLYLLVKPNASKHWYFKYRFAGKEKKMPLGPYPEVSLAEARIERDKARLKIVEGVDPMLERKRDKATAHINGANTFCSVANEYINHKMVGDGRSPATVKKARWFLEQIVRRQNIWHFWLLKLAEHWPHQLG